MIWIIEFFDWALGRRERRAEREAYLAALAAVADASKAQSEMLRSWFDGLKQQSETPARGWTTTDREQYINEMVRENPQMFAGMPQSIRDNPAAIEEWMHEELLKI